MDLDESRYQLRQESMCREKANLKNKLITNKHIDSDNVGSDRVINVGVKQLKSNREEKQKSDEKKHSHISWKHQDIDCDLVGDSSDLFLRGDVSGGMDVANDIDNNSGVEDSINKYPDTAHFVNPQMVEIEHIALSGNDEGATFVDDYCMVSEDNYDNELSDGESISSVQDVHRSFEQPGSTTLNINVNRTATACEYTSDGEENVHCISGNHAPRIRNANEVPLEGGAVPSVEWVPYVTETVNFIDDETDPELLSYGNLDGVVMGSVVSSSESSSVEEDPHMVDMGDVVLVENDDETGSVKDDDHGTVYSGQVVKETTKWDEPAAKLCPKVTKGRLTMIFLSFILFALVLTTAVLIFSKSMETPSVGKSQYPNEVPSNYPSLNLPVHDHSWSKVWADIEGEDSYEAFGKSVALTYDGARLYAGGKNVLRIYEPVLSGNGWALLKDLTLYMNATIESMSTSSDGKHIIVGDILDHYLTGKVMVFSEISLSNWDKKGDSISGKKREDMFGNTVDISDDGNIILGGSRNGNYATIFLWGGKWNHKHDMNGNPNQRFASSVSMSADGSKIAIAEPGRTDSYTGFVRTYANGGYVESAYLSSDTPVKNFGKYVKLSRHGRYLAIASESLVIRTYILEENICLPLGYGIEVSGVVSSLTLSFDGTRMLVGSKVEAKVYVYAITNDEWSKVGEFSGSTYTQFGTSATISGDGNRVVIGAFESNRSGYKSGHLETYENAVY